MSVKDSFRLVQAFNHADIYTIDDTSVLIIEATSTYLPIGEFKRVFDRAEEVIREQSIRKTVFDKRKLSVFHQPSMEWYFATWKEVLMDAGVRTHRKLLPDDFAFRQSVKIGRAKIREKYPELRTDHMDIQYTESLEEAIYHWTKGTALT